MGFLISSCVFKSYFKQLFPQYFSIWSMATSWKYLPVLGTPTFNKTHSNSTHPGELVDCLKALVDRLGEEGSKLLVVENLKVTTWKKKDIKLDFLIEKKILNPALLFVINVRGFCTNLVGFCTQWQGANCSAGCSLDFEQRWHCHSDTLQIPPPQCSTASHLVLESIQKQVYLITQAADNMKPKYKKKKTHKKFIWSQRLCPHSMGTYVSACELYCRVAVHIGQQAQTEAFGVGRVCESVYCEGRLRSVEGLSNTLVQLIVGDGAPESWFTVGHWL